MTEDISLNAFTAIDATGQTSTYIEAPRGIGAAAKAAKMGAISDNEFEAWKRGIANLHQSEQLFASEGYFLFICR